MRNVQDVYSMFFNIIQIVIEPIVHNSVSVNIVACCGACVDTIQHKIEYMRTKDLIFPMSSE